MGGLVIVLTIIAYIVVVVGFSGDVGKNISLVIGLVTVVIFLSSSSVVKVG